MNRIKLTILYVLGFLAFINLSACERAAEEKKTTEFSKLDIPMTGAQAGNTSTALGSMDVHYSKETRILTYTVRWSGLADSIAFMRVMGPAPIGYGSTNVIQNIVSTPNPPSTVTSPFPQKNAQGKFTFSRTGSLTATLLVDGVVVKEADLLNGMYFIVIFSNVAPYSTLGEIRGQIRFQ